MKTQRNCLKNSLHDAQEAYTQTCLSIGGEEPLEAAGCDVLGVDLTGEQHLDGLPVVSVEGGVDGGYNHGTQLV